jgi:glycosyltransferase involved in cell wall biosynthesis
MIVRKGADFTRHIEKETRVINAPTNGKIGMILYSLYWLLINRYHMKKTIIVTEPSVLGVIGYLGKKLCGCKWMVDVWDIPIRYTGNSRMIGARIKLTRKVMKHLYRKADLFVVGIRTDMDFRYYDIPKDKVLAWQTTIRLPDYTQSIREYVPQNEFAILCMKSEHNPDCGLDVLAEAYKILKPKLNNIKIWIIGRVRDDVYKSIKYLKDDPNFVFAGFMEHTNLMNLIKESDLCVIPWHDTGDLAQLYPTKVMEYITEGKAVIAACVAGISDMICDGYNGILFPPGDAEELAVKIEYLYWNRQVISELTLNGQKYNKRFDAVAKNEAILYTMNELIEKNDVKYAVHAFSINS